MRSNFTYLLNEEKIRTQLLQQSQPLSENAWEKFAAYSEAQPRPIRARKLSDIRIPINRRVMVPAAAAIVIITLTVFLVNYLDFGSSHNGQAVAEEPFVPAPQVAETEHASFHAEAEHGLAASTGPDSKSAALETAAPANTVAAETVPVQKKETAPAVTPPAPATNPGPQPVTATQQASAKKKIRRNEAEVLEPVQLPDIRPTLLTQEQEEDIRPN